MEKPRIIIIGGANGSGKTTLAREYVAVENIKYLGADEIARELNEEKPEDAAIKAARLFSQRLHDLLKNRESFVVESTLSGLSLQRRIEKTRKFGYAVEVVFVYLDSAELCVQRVAARVAQGGHHVLSEDVRRRFSRVNRNFWNIYKEIADKWNLFFDVTDSFQQIAAADREGVIIFDEERYPEWLKMVS